MKKLAFVSVFLFVVMGFVGGVQAYTITTYTQFMGAGGWLEAINPTTYVNENFEDTTLEPGLSITEFNGVGTIEFGVYSNIVNDVPLRYQIFNYAPGMYAFGGFFNTLIPGGPGASINVYINDNNQFALNIPNTANDDFYGFVVASGSFTGVRFADGGQPGQETYYGIDISLARVPEPASMLLLGLGIMGIGFLARRNRKS